VHILIQTCLHTHFSPPQKALHPAAMSWEKRIECLEALKDVGYQVGAGWRAGLRM
jgi:hypothetical protein